MHRQRLGQINLIFGLMPGKWEWKEEEFES